MGKNVTKATLFMSMNFSILNQKTNMCSLLVFNMKILLEAVT